MTERIEWDVKYEIGEAKIDAQHRSLIHMMNGFYRELSQQKADVFIMLDLLGAYADHHFGYEEECMVRFKCPIHETNKNAHADFRKMIQDYRKKLESEERSMEAQGLIGQELFESLKSWLFSHILRIDKQLTPAMTAAESGEGQSEHH